MNTTDYQLQLRLLMLQKKVCTAKLSRLADLNPGTVYKFLQGRSDMTSKNLAKCFDALRNLKNMEKEN